LFQEIKRKGVNKMTRNEIIGYLCGHPGSRLDYSPVVLELERDGLIQCRNGKFYLTLVGWRIAMWKWEV
jgi:hypothetical protein